MPREVKRHKKVPVNISLHPKEKETAEKMADEEDRSLSYFIGKLIRKAAEEKKAH